MNIRNLATLVAVPIGLGISQSAAAYIDPGTGSLILQGLIAAIAATAVTLRLYWDKVRAFFSRKQDTVEDSDRDGHGGDDRDGN
ncbi:MAG: hypothetical protein AAF628_23340 [Planctomycetota bacterium]